MIFYKAILHLFLASGEFYETNSQKDRKEGSTPSNSASSRGKPPLHYTNEQFFDDTNDKTSFLYIGV